MRVQSFRMYLSPRSSVHRTERRLSTIKQDYDTIVRQNPWLSAHLLPAGTAVVHSQLSDFCICQLSVCDALLSRSPEKTHRVAPSPQAHR